MTKSSCGSAALWLSRWDWDSRLRAETGGRTRPFLKIIISPSAPLGLSAVLGAPFFHRMGSEGPERMIYLLSGDERRRVRCRILLTRLLNWKHFRPAPVKRLPELMQGGYEAYRRNADRRILSRLFFYEIREGGEAVLDGADGAELLRAMLETGRAFFEGGNHLRAAWGDPLPASPEWTHGEDGLWRTELRNPDTPLEVFATAPPCYVDLSAAPNRAGFLSTDWPDALACDWLKIPPVEQEEATPYCLRLFNRYPEHTVPAPGDLAGDDDAARTAVPRLKILQEDADDSPAPGTLHDLNDWLLVRPSFLYGSREVPWHDDRPTISIQENGRVLRLRRDRDTEEKALRRLKNLGFEEKPSNPQGLLFDFNQGDFRLAPEAALTWEDLFADEFPRLREAGWEIDFETRFSPVLPKTGDWFSRIEAAGRDWFSYSAGFRVNGQTVHVLPLLRRFLKSHRDDSLPRLRERFLNTTFIVTAGEKNGRGFLIPGQQLVFLVDTLFELGSVPLTDDGALRVSRWRAAELALDTEAETPETFDLTRLSHLRERLGSEQRLEAPSGLPAAAAKLRDYQKAGLGWLDFLRETGTHGILADDMGLGKTRHALVHLLHEKHQGRLEKPALVVAPTSVLGNWVREAKAETPGLRVHSHHGTERERNWQAAQTADVVVTSYPLLHRDIDLLAGVDWGFTILDEAQLIKNPRSLTARAARRLRAERRLCLSGTPMENHLGELWSLFQFLMPGFLGSEDHFREVFRRPIENNEGTESRRIAERLSRRIAPFVLRRRKEDVATELPPKTEITHRIDPAPRQAQLYEGLRLRMLEEVRRELEARGIEQSQVFILDALLQLRLLCCDPRLGRDGSGTHESEDSAKLGRLLELLEELLAEGRRVLVFSQFVSMLDLIAPELEARGWQALRLTGKTANRQEVIDAFENGDAPIMLISLKAGGVGLNLTAADTVIHYDPWWNPAVEAQATDRAHRIGQDKPVFVHRLIVEGTVEAKMLELHARKRSLVDQLLENRPTDRILLDREALEELMGEERLTERTAC